MAFDRSRLDPNSSGSSGVPTRATYYRPSETLATIQAAGYFDTDFDVIKTVGVLRVFASDGFQDYRISSDVVDRTITLTPAGMSEVAPRQIASDAYTLKQTDHLQILDFTGGSPITVTVPLGLSLPFRVGISQGGAGQVSLSAAGGVTINEPSAQLSSAQQYDMLVLIGFASESYRLFGNTA